MKAVIAIPCYNEEKILEKNIIEILEAVKNFPHDVKIVISDNASSDRTAEIGRRLAAENEKIDYVFVAEPGKGAAVMEAWKKYDADIYGFMDADLAADLEALPRALEFLTPPSASPLPPDYRGKIYDIVIGSRRVRGAEVRRELYRKFTSAVLNFMIRAILGTKIKDTPCGFKFMRKNVFQAVIPRIKDRKWVFDTELVILAERARLDSDESERAGFKIKELPVKWEEKGERGSRVNIYPTAREYIKIILKLKNRL